MNSFSLTALGTGTALPEPDRSTSAFLIAHGEKRILFDIGDGTLQRLHMAKSHILTLDALILSHAHFDHLAGVFPLLFALHVPAFERTSPLHIYLSAETFSYVRRTQEVFGKWLQPPAEKVVFHTISSGDSFSLCGLRVTAHAVCHDSSSLGFRFKSPNGVIIALPSDTGPCDSLLSLCQNADLAVLECGLSDEFANEMHLAPKDLISLLRQANVKHAAIVHRYPVAHQANVVETIRRGLDKITKITAAKDGQVFVL